MEASLDAWTFHAAGHRNAVAFEKQQLTKQDFTKVRRVLLADPSIGSNSMIEVDLLRIHFPEAMSVNEYAILNRTADDALGKRIRAASVVDRRIGSLPVDERRSNHE